MVFKTRHTDQEPRENTVTENLSAFAPSAGALSDVAAIWHALIGNTDDIIQILDQDGHILYMNRAFPTHSLEKTIGESFLAMLTRESQIEARKALKKMQNRASLQTLEISIPLSDTESVQFETKWMPIETGNSLAWIVALNRDITVAKQAEAALKSSLYNLERTVIKRTRILVERVKELKCLLSISKLFDRPDTPLPATLKAVADLIASSWQYPNITSVRITLEGTEAQTINFIETQWKQTCGISLYGEQIGLLEVCYLESRPDIDAGPFSKKEIGLLESIAESLSHMIARKRMEEELKSKAQSLEALNSALNTTFNQRNQDRAEYENRLVENTKSLILPFLSQLSAITQGEHQLALIDSIRENLNEVASSFSHSLTSKNFNLSSAEIRVAQFVKMGKSSKDIANILRISIKTVKNHRHKIREKLGIKNRSTNLRTFLLYLE